MTNCSISLESVRCLKVELEKQKPQHDSPIGLIHPYWARKPLNIVSNIINRLSHKGDIILDPFCGSGTVPFSALSNERHALASDLNPLSVFITQNILELGRFTEDDLKYIRFFFGEAAKEYSQWFLVENMMIERIRYQVSGEYKNGNFILKPIEIVGKSQTKTGWRGRNIHKLDNLPKNVELQRFCNYPTDFRKIILPENSRIAIPKGALLSHFFDEHNSAAINLIYSKISNAQVSEKIRSALLFILSSALPLLRLSDKKATSQWPYWRPKTNVTSRNPLFVINNRVDSFSEAVSWVKEKIHLIGPVSLSAIYKDSKFGSYCVFQSAAQLIKEKGIKKNTIDLILTDPPYADQAPYLEYSQLWNNLLFNQIGSEFYKQEIVKTDAPARKKDSSEYIGRLTAAIKVCCECVKHAGFFAFFYQDRSLIHWTEIAKTLRDSNMSVVEVIALPKQRRSLKTVTTPGRTLDGDLLVIAKKGRVSQSDMLQSKKISIPKSRESLFDKYAFLIREGLMNESLESLLIEDSDIFSLIAKQN